MLDKSIKDAIIEACQFEDFIPKAPKTTHKRQPTQIKYNGQIIAIKGKTLWNMPGHAKSAVRNAIEYKLGYKLFKQELNMMHSDPGYAYYWVFIPTNTRISSEEKTELEIAIFQFIYNEVLTFEAI
jgi:hypothetical protein